MTPTLLPADSPAHRWRPRLALLALAVLVACGGGHDAAPTDSGAEEDAATTDAPTAAPTRHATAAVQAVAAGQVPVGGALAGTQGVFGPLTDWPLMPIHQVLLPDGRVLFYGSDINGQQGGGLHYAVWDPTLGMGSDAFTVLPTVTGTDIFCAGQALQPNGDVLIIGGTVEINGQRGNGSDESNLFSVSGNTLVSQTRMSWRRWYATLLTLSDGTQLALGGRMDRGGSTTGAGIRSNADNPDLAASTGATYATTPELWSNGTWTAMTGATSDALFGATDQNWYYPRAWVMPSGKVFLLSPSGTMFQMNPTAPGTLLKFTTTTQKSNARLQSVMFQPGKILSVRQKQTTVIIDVNGKQPVVTTTPSSSRYRQFGNATLLADGQMWFSGGSADGNVTTNDYLVSETWNPATGQWTDGASASVARLYHSTALLLPDGTVATGGGGDPGPYRWLNGEIYYPPYLYLKDGSGQPAPRPAITSAPQALTWSQPFEVGVDSATPVSRVTLVRTGIVTHDFNSNQRFQELTFTQSGGTLTTKTPASSGVAPPGYYLLFVFDANGVPSVAKIIHLSA